MHNDIINNIERRAVFLRQLSFLLLSLGSLQQHNDLMNYRPITRRLRCDYTVFGS